MAIKLDPKAVGPHVRTLALTAMAPFAKQHGTPLKRSESMKNPNLQGKQKLNRHEIARLAAIQPDNEENVPAEPQAVPQQDTNTLPVPDEGLRGRPRAMTSPQEPTRSFSAGRAPDVSQAGALENGKAEALSSPKRNTLNGDPVAPPAEANNNQGQLQPAPALLDASIVPSVLASPVPEANAARSGGASREPPPPIDTKRANEEEENRDADETSETVTSNPATGAYRDLTTGAVVETDNDGNQAEPTTHPSIRSVENTPNLGSGAGITSPDDEMPGLKAAAEFLSNDRTVTRVTGGDGNEDRAQVLQAANEEEAKGDDWKDVTPQVTGFAIASSKRNDDFHSLFPSVPEDDFLIESYGCAISRDLLIQGRMYVSEGCVCFYSSIFGWVTSIVVPFADIVSIEKRNTAYLIPNAILVKTLQNKYLFSSLVARDMTYSMLVNIWRLSQPSASAQQHAAASEGAPEIQSEDEKEREKNVSGKSTSKRERLRRRLAIARHQAKKHEQNTGDALDTSTGAASVSTHDDDQSSESSDSNDDQDEEIEGNHEPTECDCEKKGLHLSSLVLDEEFSTTPRRLFNLLFCDDFMSSFLTENQHLTDLNIGEWENDNVGTGVTAARKVTYVKPLNGPIGPKQTRCEISEEQLHIDFDGFCTTMTTTRTPDVPNGSSFVIKTRTCFTWAENNASRLMVTCAVEWSGRSMIRGIIDKASIEGQKQYYMDLAESIRQHLSSQTSQDSKDGAKAGAASMQKTKSESSSSTSAKQVPVSPTPSSPPSAKRPIVPPKSSETIWDKVQDLVNTSAEALNTRPTVLLLGALIVLLLLSHVVIFFRGAPGVSRSPSHPHRLLTTSSVSRQQPLSLRHATLMIDEEVQQTLDALQHSRHLTEALELEIKTLRDTIQEQARQYRESLEASK